MPGGTWETQGSADTIPAFRPAEAAEMQEDRIPYKHWAPSITLLSPGGNLHGRDARATWHGHLAHGVLMS